MASFCGATFKQRVYSAPWEIGGEVSERHVHGGDINYIDIGGKTCDHKTITAYFETDAQRAAIAAKVLTQGVLIDVDGTCTALLTRMRRSARYPKDKQYADLDFTI